MRRPHPVRRTAVRRDAVGLGAVHPEVGGRCEVRAGAASASLREVLTGADLEGRVACVFPRACYVDVPGRVVALLAEDAVRLPNGLVVAGDHPLAGLEPGMRATVGSGRVRVGSLTVRVARWWSVRPRRPLARPEALGHRAARLRALAGPPPLDPRRVRRCETTDPDALFSACVGLLGLGPGLTPAGDDAVAGLLVALRRLGHVDLADRVGPPVAAAARRRTTSLSATLLDHAARGEAADVALDVVDALAGHRGLDPAADVLFALGHSSGRDMAAGLAIGAALAAGDPGRGADAGKAHP